MAIVVHFGMHKTGSSSIQASLYRGLSDPRFMYISMGGANQSGIVATLFMEHPETLPLHKKLGRSSAEVQALRTLYLERLYGQASTLGGRTALLSAERISHMSPPELVALRDCLAAHFGDVRMVGYVRTPKSYIESAFQERVKGARWMEGGADVFASFWPAYQQRFGAYDEIFGAANVEFWLFDPARFENRDVVADFTARLGIRYESEGAVRSNESIGLPAVKLLYTMRRLGPLLESGPHLVRCNARLVDAVSELGGPPLRLDPQVAESILERNMGDLEWMERRMGCLLREEFSRRDGPAVASEQDLFEVGPAEIEWLSARAGGGAVSAFLDGTNPNIVARLMHGLYQKICAEEAASDNGVAGER